MSTEKKRADRICLEDIGKQLTIKVAEKTWVIGPLMNFHTSTVDKKTVIMVDIHGVEGVGAFHDGAYSVFGSYQRATHFTLKPRDEVTIGDA